MNHYMIGNVLYVSVQTTRPLSEHSQVLVATTNKTATSQLVEALAEKIRMTLPDLIKAVEPPTDSDLITGFYTFKVFPRDNSAFTEVQQTMIHDIVETIWKEAILTE